MYMMKCKLGESGLTEFNNQTRIIYLSLPQLVDDHLFPVWPSLVKPVYQ